MKKVPRALVFVSKVIITAYAVIGFVLTTGFVALRLGWTNVGGSVDSQSDVYNKLAEQVQKVEKTQVHADVPQASASPETLPAELQQLCKVDVIGVVSPKTAWNILHVYNGSGSLSNLMQMVQAAAFRLPADGSIHDKFVSCDSEMYYSRYTLAGLNARYPSPDGTSIFPWENTAEWQTSTQGILKDADKINQVAKATGVQPREIAVVCLVEQLRLYFTQRELYEKVFKPLNVLSTATKSAWGVMAVKEKTAIAVEQHLKDPTSPYYLGKDKENLLDFTQADQAKERYDRLTNEKDHTYSYLYGALYLAQVSAQWSREGYSIENRPEILATLFNVGFENSKPKENPQVGGSEITIDTTKYTFGGLAYELYFSGAIGTEFPL